MPGEGGSRFGFRDSSDSRFLNLSVIILEI
jgi:hypothetical protein